MALMAVNAAGIIKFLCGGDVNANEWLRIDASGNFIASNVVTSAPGASLNNSQYQFCVYDNSGTAVFEVRYKNASGTVKVGTLALAMCGVRTTLGTVRIRLRSYSRSRRSCTISICKSPRNPQRKPEPKDCEFSGSETKEASDNFNLSIASRKDGKSPGLTG